MLGPGVMRQNSRARDTSVQGERVTAPSDILPAAKVREHLRAARLSHWQEILEPQFFETAAKPPLFPHLDCDEQTLCSRREASELYIAFIGNVRTGWDNVDRPALRAFAEDPELAPALERLYGEHQSPAPRNGLSRRQPHDAVRTAPHEHRGRMMCLGERYAGLSRFPRAGSEHQRPRLRCVRNRRPAYRPHPQQRIQILSAPLFAEILRMHGDKLSERALRRSHGGVTAPRLPIGDGGAHCRTARVQSA